MGHVIAIILNHWDGSLFGWVYYKPSSVGQESSIVISFVSTRGVICLCVHSFGGFLRTSVMFPALAWRPGPYYGRNLVPVTGAVKRDELTQLSDFGGSPSAPAERPGRCP